VRGSWPTVSHSTQQDHALLPPQTEWTNLIVERGIVLIFGHDTVSRRAGSFPMLCCAQYFRIATGNLHNTAQTATQAQTQCWFQCRCDQRERGCPEFGRMTCNANDLHGSVSITGSVQLARAVRSVGAQLRRLGHSASVRLRAGAAVRRSATNFANFIVFTDRPHGLAQGRVFDLLPPSPCPCDISMNVH
jgi:hypothetical protein